MSANKLFQTASEECLKARDTLRYAVTLIFDLLILNVGSVFAVT